MTLPASLAVTVGGRTLNAAEAAVAGVRIELSDGGAHDAAELLLWSGSKLRSLAPGEPLSLSLGSSGSEKKVWSGQVIESEEGPEGVHLTGVAPTACLSHSFRAQAYVQQSIGDMVRDLASEADVEVVACDLRLESFVVDSRLSVWEHILELARLSGCTVSASAAGALRFQSPATKSASHQLRHGVDLLSWRLGDRPLAVARAVAAHGAASTQGGSRWHWLHHDPAPGAASEATQILGAFHTQGAADALSEARASAAERRRKVGDLHLWGKAEIRPGDALELLDLPGGDQDLRVRGVVHRLDGRHGFRTECQVEGGASSGGLLGALGL